PELTGLHRGEKSTARADRARPALAPCRRREPPAPPSAPDRRSGSTLRRGVSMRHSSMRHLDLHPHAIDAARVIALAHEARVVGLQLHPVLVEVVAEAARELFDPPERVAVARPEAVDPRVAPRDLERKRRQEVARLQREAGAVAARG